MKQKEQWFSQPLTRPTNPKYQQIKITFQKALQDQSNDTKINYYDFLLVAKKLGFRFQQSIHLMALKNYFTKMRNILTIKKLVDLLCVSTQSLNSNDDKIVVKFSVPDTQFQSIKQVTNQDQDNYGSDQELHQDQFDQIGKPNIDQLDNKQINEKIIIILSIKIQEMTRKLKILTNQQQQPNIFTVFNNIEKQINFDMFRKGQSKRKIKLSQDDIRTLFYMIDSQQKGQIVAQDLHIFGHPDVYDKMKEFYYSRINRDMIKNTVFKLGKKDSGIQVFQLKNASVLEFKQMQDSIVNDNKPLIKTFKQIKRIPHFGPLKGANRIKKAYATQNVKSSNSLEPLQNRQLVDRQREKIQKILRGSKQQKKRDKNGQTIASKLRSLFIHKVILPREKMLAQEKQKIQRLKVSQNQLTIKPTK